MVEIENLSAMLRDYKAQASNVPAPDPIHEIDTGDTQEEVATNETEQPVALQFITFNNWIEKNLDALRTTSHIERVGIRVKDVDPDDSIAFKAPKNKKDIPEGEAPKDLFFLKGFSEFPIPDLPVYKMNIYRNDAFRIIADAGNDTYIKMYSIKTGPVLVFIKKVWGIMIPYKIIKMKKRDMEVVVPDAPVDMLNSVYQDQTDMENLQLLYKQSIKAKVSLAAMQDATKWLIGRQEGAVDLNHHLQIDHVLMTLYHCNKK